MTTTGQESGTTALRDGDETALPQRLVLAVVSGKLRGKTVPLRGTVRIGKASDNDLVLPDETVSRHHCELSLSPDGVHIRDLGSTNGVRVGGAQIQEATVTAGTPVRVGGVDVVVRSEVDRTRILPSENETFGEALGPSLVMRGIFGVLERIAVTDAAVLLEGETGTGKDVLARSIHQKSPRGREPFVVVDCGAVSYNLIESELFGHERGAFTGAVASRHGAFETAGRGTIFLDEVGELPLDVQPKLLRVLETGEFRRVGGNKVFRHQARVVAATKRNLQEEVSRGKFREDLYFRLAVVPLTVPPLRARREDVTALVGHFLEVAHQRNPAAPRCRVSSETLAGLSAHDWPGNVRELRNVLDRAVYMAQAVGESELSIMDLSVGTQLGTVAEALSPFEFSPEETYRETRAAFEARFEHAYVSWLLDRHGGNISAAAREAKMDRKHLYDLARRHGLRKKDG